MLESLLPTHAAQLLQAPVFALAAWAVLLTIAFWGVSLVRSPETAGAAEHGRGHLLVTATQVTAAGVLTYLALQGVHFLM